jgi:tRNA(adenine34) deaminase
VARLQRTEGVVDRPTYRGEVNDDDAMRMALAQARRAQRHGDVPVGAIVVHNGQVIAEACNEREFRNDPTAHAEVLAMRDAATRLGRWRLNDCTLYVTLEPCAMCAGAIVNSRIERVVYATPDLKAGAMGSLYNLSADPRLNHEPQVRVGVLADESGALLGEFFRARR